MPSTRDMVTIEVRDHVSRNIVNIQARGHGQAQQPQCSRGELEWDSNGKKFVFIPADKRVALPKRK